MLTIIFRAIIIYIIVLFVFRVMGKRQIGQMQPFELVITLIIADLATIPMAEISVPVLHGIVPLLTLVIMHFVISLIVKLSPMVAGFVSGKPVIVINPKGIDYKAMKQLEISVDDLFEAIRGQGYFAIEQVQYAIMETTGKISVMPKSEFAPVTNSDMSLDIEESFIPINLISEGKLMKDNFSIANVTEERIIQFVKKKTNSHVKIKNVLLLTFEKSGNIFLQMKDGEGMSFQGEKI